MKLIIYVFNICKILFISQKKNKVLVIFFLVYKRIFAMYKCKKCFNKNQKFTKSKLQMT